MSRYTNQEIIDRTVSHFIMDMAQQCTNGMGKCAYWSSDHPKNRCAVGQLLTEQEAEQWERHLGMGSLHNLFLDAQNQAGQNEVLRIFSYAQLPLLHRIQYWHDECLNPNTYPDQTPGYRLSTFRAEISNLKEHCPGFADLTVELPTGTTPCKTQRTTSTPTTTSESSTASPTTSSL